MSVLHASPAGPTVVAASMQAELNHDIDQWPPVAQVKFTSGLASLGLFTASPKGTYATIELDPSAELVSLTQLHELGHFVDYTVGNGGWASETDPRLDGWNQAVANSDAFAAIAKRSQSPEGDQPYPKWGTLRKYLQGYVLTPRELFARSYCQYIVRQAADETLREGLAEMQRTQYYRQWDDSDFEPIESEIDRLFQELTWA